MLAWINQWYVYIQKDTVQRCVILMSNSWKYTKEAILDTPSIRAGMKPSLEAWTRVKACLFATKCGEALGL